MVAHGAAGTSDTPMAPMYNRATVYTDPVRFAAEQRILFGTLPLVAGLSGDVPNPGDRMLFEAAGPSILIMRGKDGVLRGFLNMCTHRGASWCANAATGARVTCPFHAWTYDTQGALIGLPGAVSFPGVEKSERGLIPVPLAEWHGIIFVIPRAGSDEIDVDGFLGDMAPVLAQLELSRAEPSKPAKCAPRPTGNSRSTPTARAIISAHCTPRPSARRITTTSRFMTVSAHHRVGFPEKATGH